MRKCKNNSYEHIEILSSDWYTGGLFVDGITENKMYCIGIVTYKDTITGEIGKRIGLGTGTNQEYDEDLIIATGRHFYG